MKSGGTASSSESYVRDDGDKLLSIMSDLIPRAFAYNGFGARASLVDSAGTWNFRRDGADVNNHRDLDMGKPTKNTLNHRKAVWDDHGLPATTLGGIYYHKGLWSMVDTAERGFHGTS